MLRCPRANSRSRCGRKRRGTPKVLSLNRRHSKHSSTLPPARKRSSLASQIFFISPLTREPYVARRKRPSLPRVKSRSSICSVPTTSVFFYVDSPSRTVRSRRPFSTVTRYLTVGLQSGGWSVVMLTTLFLCFIESTDAGHVSLLGPSGPYQGRNRNDPTIQGKILHLDFHSK